MPFIIYYAIYIIYYNNVSYSVTNIYSFSMPPKEANYLPSPGRDFVSSFAKGLLLLASFTRQQPAMTLSEVAKANRMNLPMARRYLNTLKQMGFVFHDEKTKRYRLTAKVLRLGSWVIEGMDLRTRLLPYMNQITSQMDITTSCAIIENSEAVTIERIRSKDVINLDLTAGSRLPVHATSLGKAILAFLPVAEREALLERIDFTGYTTYTKTSRVALRMELEAIRRDGYATADQELSYGLKSIAVPIFDKHGKVEASLGVSYPCYRAESQGLERALIETLLDVCRKTSGVFVPFAETSAKRRAAG